MYEVQVTEKGDIRLPVSVRRKYRIRAGGRIRPEEREGEIVLRTDPMEAIDEVCGMLKAYGPATPLLLKERAMDRRKEDVKAKPRRSR